MNKMEDGGLTVVILAALLACACAANAQAPRMPWVVPDAETRLVFGVPPGSSGHALVRAPVGKCVGNSTRFGVTDGRGWWLPVRAVFANGSELCLDVDMGQPPSDVPPSLSIYFGNVPLPEVGEPEPDRKPVLVSVHRCSGKSPPNKWDKMLYLFDRSRLPVATTFTKSLSGFTVSDEGTARPLMGLARQFGRWRERQEARRWIVFARASALCPVSGSYRFAVSGSDPAFLFVDGKPASESADRYASGMEWYLGPSMNLEAGPHSIELFVSCDREPDVAVGWQTPADADQSTAESVPVVNPIDTECLVSGLEPHWLRIETRDALLMPGYIATIQPSYSFRGRSAVFTPVRFTLDGSVPDGAFIGLDAGDGFNPGLQPETGPVIHVYTAARKYRSSLEMLDQDGHISSMTCNVDLRFVQPREYAVEFGLDPIPSACYPEDPIEPTFIAGGSAPRDAAMELTVSRKFRDGRMETFETNLVVSGPNQFIPLSRAMPSEVETFSWSVSHAGLTMASERIRFMLPPFEAGWFRSKGSSLMSETGESIVLVPGRTAAPESSPWRVRRPVDRIVFYDDALDAAGTPGGWLRTLVPREFSRNGAHRPPDAETVRAPGPETNPRTASKLLRFTGMPRRLDSGTDVLVLSIGLGDALNDTPAPEYERLLAAMVDVFSATRGCRVLCVTLPPFRFNPGLLREYAAAVHRVASARGLPVADLYTAFHSALDSPGQGLADGELGLSYEGRRLSAKVMAGAVRIAVETGGAEGRRAERVESALGADSASNGTARDWRP